MQINKDYESTINLRDLLFHILYRWRSILIVAIICSLALFAYQYFTIKATHDEGKQTKEERQLQLDIQNYQDELESNRGKIRFYTQLLQKQNNYRDKSIYIQLNPQSMWIATNNYLVITDQSVIDALPQGYTHDPADDILAAYTAPLSGADDDKLKAAFGTEETEYISELVDTLTDAIQNTITVTVKGPTKESVQNGMALLNSQIESLAKGKAQEIKPHKLSLVSESVFLGADLDLPKKQEDLAKSIDEGQKYLKEARQKLDELENRTMAKEAGKGFKKMAATGFILGVLLMVGFYILSYLFNNRLKHGSILTDHYNLSIFGEFNKNKSLHNGKGLDKLIAKWEVGEKIVDDDIIYSKITSLIEEQGESKELLLLSTLLEEKLLSVQNELSVRLPRKTILIKGAFLLNRDAVAEATKADAVVLVEEKNTSCLKDIDSMAETLIIGKVNVIGAIIL